MDLNFRRFAPLALGVALMFSSQLAFGSVESSLLAVQTKLINVILPLAGILGLVFAAFSFFTGNPGARSHLFLAILGAAIGFGAPSIIDFVHGLIN